MPKERKFLNGLPLLIMLSINSRVSGADPYDCYVDGATVFEIENDIEDVTTVRPQQGTIDSAMGTLRERGYVDRELVQLGHFQTYVHTLSEKGQCRALGFMKCLERLKVHKPRESRGPRVSSPDRKRPRKKYPPPA